MSKAWDALNRKIVACERCPRLREYCKQVAIEKRAAFRNEKYWGRPIPNFGDPNGRLLIVGLAPAAHGGNRTGRVFTGDRSGDFLFSALYDAGFASQPTSIRRDDGLRLIDCAMTAIAHCAPPANKPLPCEIANCASYLERTIDLMPNLRGVVALGKIAFDGCVRTFIARRWIERKSRPQFGHARFYQFGARPFLIGSFHPSQQNTFTGKLTPKMIRDVFFQSRQLVSEEVIGLKRS